MDKEIIKKIIEAGNHAPSGSNSQPWKFIFQNEILQLIALPEKDHKIFNFKKRGTYIAHGALMENIKVASNHFGYEPRFNLFPDENSSAKVTFDVSTERNQDDLHDSIFERHTNRKPYEIKALPQEEREYLLKEAAKFPQCKVVLVEGDEIKQVAENLAFDIAVSLENSLLHKLLFEEIIWEESEQKHRSGLYVKTMETTGPKAFVFKMLGNWRIAKFFTQIGLVRKIYAENVKTMSSSGLIGAVIIKETDENFITAGRVMENIWLRATKLGLSFHLITGVVFLWQQMNFGKKEIFDEKQKHTINRAYKALGRYFHAEDKIIALTFRIGRGDKPMAVSYKRPAEIEWN